MTSVKYAAFTIVVSTTIGLFGACAVIYGSARYRFLNLLTALPVVVSAVTLGLGMIVTFDVDPIDWRGAWLLDAVPQRLNPHKISPFFPAFVKRVQRLASLNIQVLE